MEVLRTGTTIIVQVYELKANLINTYKCISGTHFSSLGFQNPWNACIHCKKKKNSDFFFFFEVRKSKRVLPHYFTLTLKCLKFQKKKKGQHFFKLIFLIRGRKMLLLKKLLVFVERVRVFQVSNIQFILTLSSGCLLMRNCLIRFALEKFPNRIIGS